ncbi:Retrovirus-related Pol polyprotein from transposon RE2 [Vitis vinifera]|uniref:Retrovirus-related Pol polyprotein from transposon RE2 n=1 Tax=Vitis vinifera TaxID=29760 RepID=A0A438BXT4_VITVI|nr:Retrovirus-related Pol polyprotein from transposon RE2 [Vitis vinifera]
MPPSVQAAQHTNEEEKTGLEHGSQSTCGQYIDSNSSLPEENIGEDRAGEVLIPSIDDSTLPIALRKGVRRCTDHPIGNYVTYEGYHHLTEHLLLLLMILRVPNTIQEALKFQNGRRQYKMRLMHLRRMGRDYHRFAGWEEACGVQVDFHHKIQSRWISRKIQGSILLSLAVNQDWCLQQLDIKNAVSKWDLEEEVYMEIPLVSKKVWQKNQIKERNRSLSKKIHTRSLKETGMLGCKPIDTPMDSQKKLGIEKESTPVDRGEISAACRALDLSLTHSARYWLCSECWKGLFFRKTENRDTEVYSDADWAGNIIDRRSTSGYCSFVWGNLVTWRSKKQSVVARSSAEAEYRALAQGICEGIWIKRVLSELGQTSSSPILMMCDNQASYKHSKEPRAS